MAYSSWMAAANNIPDPEPVEPERGGFVSQTVSRPQGVVRTGSAQQGSGLGGEIAGFRRRVGGYVRDLATELPNTRIDVDAAKRLGQYGLQQSNPFTSAASLVSDPYAHVTEGLSAITTPVLRGSRIGEAASVPLNFLPFGRGVSTLGKIGENVIGSVGGQLLAEGADENLPKDMNPIVRGGLVLGAGIAGFEGLTNPKVGRAVAKGATTYRDLTENIPMGMSIRALKDEPTVTLYRGDPKATGPLSLDKSKFGAAQGRGLYFTDDVEVAGAYEAQGHGSTRPLGVVGATDYSGRPVLTPADAIRDFRESQARQIIVKGNRVDPEFRALDGREKYARALEMVDKEFPPESMRAARPGNSNGWLIRSGDSTAQTTTIQMPQSVVNRVADTQKQLPKEFGARYRAGLVAQGLNDEQIGGLVAPGGSYSDFFGRIKFPTLHVGGVSDADATRATLKAQTALRRAMSDSGFTGLRYTHMGKNAYVFWDEQAIQRLQRGEQVKRPRMVGGSGDEPIPGMPEPGLSPLEAARREVQDGQAKGIPLRPVKDGEVTALQAKIAREGMTEENKGWMEVLQARLFQTTPNPYTAEPPPTPSTAIGRALRSKIEGPEIARKGDAVAGALSKARRLDSAESRAILRQHEEAVKTAILNEDYLRSALSAVDPSDTQVAQNIARERANLRAPIERIRNGVPEAQFAAIERRARKAAADERDVVVRNLTLSLDETRSRLAALPPGPSRERQALSEQARRDIFQIGVEERAAAAIRSGSLFGKGEAVTSALAKARQAPSVTTPEGLSRWRNGDWRSGSRETPNLQTPLRVLDDSGTDAWVKYVGAPGAPLDPAAAASARIAPMMDVVEGNPAYYEAVQKFLKDDLGLGDEVVVYRGGTSRASTGAWANASLDPEVAARFGPVRSFTVPRPSIRALGDTGEAEVIFTNPRKGEVVPDALQKARQTPPDGTTLQARFIPGLSPSSGTGAVLGAAGGYGSADEDATGFEKAQAVAKGALIGMAVGSVAGTGSGRVKALQEARKLNGVQGQLGVNVTPLGRKQAARELAADIYKVFSPSELLNLTRTTASSGDFSATLRQGGWLAPRHTKELKDMFAAQVKTVFGPGGEERAQQIMRDIHNAPMAKYRRNMYMSDWNGTQVGAREEAYASSLAGEIPGVAATSRGYSIALNKYRTDIFDNTVAGWPEAARTPERLLEYQNYILAATGRGSIPKAAEGIAGLMNGLLFSSRNLWSLPQRHMAALTTDPYVRKEVIKDMAAFYGTGLTILGLAAGAKEVFDIGDKSLSINFTNFEDSTWGKIVAGPSKVDIWGGNQQLHRMFLRVGTSSPAWIGAVLNGTVKDLKASENPLKIIEQFLTYKLAPNAQMVRESATGKTAVGDDAAPLVDSFAQKAAPMILAELAETYNVWLNRVGPGKAAGITAGAGIGSGLGLGVSTYEEKKRGGGAPSFKPPVFKPPKFTP